MRTSWGPIGLAALAAACSRQEVAPSGSSTRPDVDPASSDPRDPDRGAPSRTVDPRPGTSVPSVPDSTVAEVPDDREAERRAMVDGTLVTEGIGDPRVLAAMRRVPRHRFVPEEASAAAYANRPLAIGHGQTISQPYVVAYMAEAAAPRPTDRCLEIGTGSGYQAAVLAELCAMTYSIELLVPVARFGERNLRAAGYGEDRVALRIGDGYRGWPEAAPFDVILVTAAPERIPPPLLEQLAPGGRLLAPVGPQPLVQDLERWTRLRPGSDRAAFRVERLLSVRFVPFLGEGTR